MESFVLEFLHKAGLPVEIVVEIDAFLIEQYRRESSKICAATIKKELRVCCAFETGENSGTFKLMGRTTLRYCEAHTMKYRDDMVVRITGQNIYIGMKVVSATYKLGDGTEVVEFAPDCKYSDEILVSGGYLRNI
nr:hypothetical protein K-LCC10_0262 [Kaumoebavirus]